MEKKNIIVMILNFKFLCAFSKKKKNNSDFNLKYIQK